MRFFAFYLPQFHCIPENDMWWGKGFTEWTNVKKALPIVKGQKQPKVPLNSNYYNLLNIETIQWQADLANKYGINGFIFYHYYFAGKKLLEKPAEILLNNDSISVNFFFCWANHNWYRSWEGSKELLIEQKYGSKDEWEQHFQYLINFFKDSRYEKRNNKPLFMVFKTDFTEKREMFNYFNDRCRDYGFDGICVIETCEEYDKEKINKFYNTTSDETEFIHLREPGTVKKAYYSNYHHLPHRLNNKLGRVLCAKGLISYVPRFDGNSLLAIMKKKQFSDKRIIRGLFFEWDNTPRHFTRGYIINPPNKQKVFDYLNSIKTNEYLFINAWNEWCEGMILEPTEENNYKYLEWINEWRVANKVE